MKKGDLYFYEGPYNIIYLLLDKDSYIVITNGKYIGIDSYIGYIIENCVKLDAPIN